MRISALGLRQVNVFESSQERTGNASRRLPVMQIVCKFGKVAEVLKELIVKRSIYFLLTIIKIATAKIINSKCACIINSGV